MSAVAPAAAKPAGVTDSAVARDATLLGFVAAYVDTFGFIALFGVFTAHVTGNFVMIGASLVARGGEVVAKLLVLPMFMLAVAATYIGARALEKRQRNPIVPVLVCEALLLALALALAQRDRPRIVEGGDLSIVVALLLACSMGAQNAMNRLHFRGLPPNTVMTGNVTQFVIELVAYLSGSTEERVEARRQLGRLIPLLIAFTVGATAAAFGYLWFDFWSLVLPTLACLALAGMAARRH